MSAVIALVIGFPGFYFAAVIFRIAKLKQRKDFMDHRREGFRCQKKAWLCELLKCPLRVTNSLKSFEYFSTVVRSES